jgi:NET1-associated nuclear protein 1 (U3 small nucleolar RNA-associated protein 17)
MTRKKQSVAASVEENNASAFNIELYGGNICSSQLLFSSDSKLIFIINNDQINIYSTASGELLGRLVGHTGTITSIKLNLSNSLLLYSSSLDGTIRLWDYIELSCIELVQLNSPVYDFLPANENLLYCNIYQKEHNQYKVISYNLNNKSSNLCYKSRSAGSKLVMNSAGTILASCNKHSLIIYNTSNNSKIKHLHSEALTSIAFHPSGEYLVTGDSKGRIILWYNYTTPSQLVLSQLHWHSSSVSAISFSTDGVYMLSGGHEAVLVLWQMETGHKQFIPRFQANITHITVSPNSHYYAIQLADNIINLVSAVTNKVEKTITGIIHSARNDNSSSNSTGHNAENQTKPSESAIASLLYDHRSGGLILPGRHGYIQCFHLGLNKELYEINITQRQAVSKAELSNTLHDTQVTALAISPSGDYLVSVDRRSDGYLQDKEKLKVWSFDKSNQTYVINTNIQAPHKQTIRSIVFHPQQAQFVTVAADNSFKVWTAQYKLFNPNKNSSLTPENKLYFLCKHVLSYRDYEINTAAYNSAGTLLAVGFGQVITLWDCSNYSLVNTLLQSQPITQLHFCGNSLISSSLNALYCWDSANMSLAWFIPMNVAAVAVDQASSRQFAVIHTQYNPDATNVTGKSIYSHTKKYLSVFDPLSLQPLKSYEINSCRLHAVPSPHQPNNHYFSTSLAYYYDKSAQFNPTSLIFWNKYNQVVRVLTEQEEKSSSPNSNSLPAAAPQGKSIFEQLYGNSENATANSTTPSLPQNSHLSFDRISSVINELFSGPTHAAPNTNNILQTFVQSLLTIKPNIKEEKQENSISVPIAHPIREKINCSSVTFSASMDYSVLVDCLRHNSSADESNSANQSKRKATTGAAEKRRKKNK